MKRVSPRPPSDPALLRDASDARLPDDVVADQVKRLTVFALVSGGLWGIGLLMDAVVFPRTFGAQVPTAALVIESAAVAMAVAIYAWVRLSSRAPHAKPDAGLWLMLFNAAGIALLETWAVDPNVATVGHLSWTAIVILLSAMIVPSTPGKMLAAALTAASLAPLGVWLAHLRGVEVPTVTTTMLIYMPNYSCAFAAVIPARMFQQMGRRLREARDLGSYALEERLGGGGMGEVWRAKHRLLARPAAIKLVKPEMLGADGSADARVALQRFASEAQATAALTSPHTIRLFDYGATDDGRFYYVMELLDGRDMAALVGEFGPLPVPRVLYLLRQVCHSLAEAHGRGLVHRDIKPANIFVCRMGRDADVVKVLDFGLVQHVERDPAQNLTQTLATLQGLVGTPAFMAPEMVVGDRPVDHRADLYALGCVTYFLLTGTHVFQGGTQMQALIDHVSTAPQPPSRRMATDVPDWVDALVLACLAKDPDERPRDADDVLRRIDAHAADLTWTNAQAAEWWQTHLPAATASVALDKGRETR
jgi:eukaryotic-like serine/threonine-protein kinase